ncbi:hypothetical protein HU200_061454 [Digitaria exilis]|uniref:Uncharacterized protein n=1 Tax=Digitaria exilis TaxID=1010633 RepID=A0A834ZWT5_9POAL|nr:hypothetical protein HU200_066311 [Digitaria exilis]KAF8654820.1 hypothetical protein HU200_061454 [Digitaria exilis]
MSRPAGSARWSSAAAAILLGALVVVSLVVERSSKASLPVSFAAAGGRRMMIGTMEDLKDGDDPLSSSKRRVPNGPDPIHNRYHLFLAREHGMCMCCSHSLCSFSRKVR